MHLNKCSRTTQSWKKQWEMWENTDISRFWRLKKSYLISELKYRTTKWFLENLLAIEMNETNVKNIRH